MWTGCASHGTPQPERVASSATPSNVREWPAVPHRAMSDCQESCAAADLVQRGA